MNKVSKVVGAGLLAGAIMAGPATVEATEVTIGADIASSYVFRGITLNKDAVIQPSLLAEHESGFGIEVWANFDIGDDNGAFEERQFSEVDFVVFYGYDLDFASVEIGYTEYIEEIGDAFREGYISLGTGVAGFDVGLTYYQGFQGSDENYIELSAGYGLEVIEGLEVGIGGHIGWGGKGATAGGKAGFHDYLVGLSAAYEVLEGLEVSAFFNYVGSLDSDVLPDDDVREDFVGGLGVYYTF